MKKIIVLFALLVSTGAFAADITAVQHDLLDRAEGYCADKVSKKSHQFIKCVDEAYNLGWNRYKEAAQLQLAQNRARQEQLILEQRMALELQAAKERRQAEGLADLARAAQMAAPVRYGTTCTSRAMVAGTVTTQCF